MTVRFKKRRTLKKLNRAVYITIFSVFAIIFWVSAKNRGDSPVLIKDAELIEEENVADISVKNRNVSTSVEIPAVDEDELEAMDEEIDAETVTDYSDYKGLFMANVDDCLSIREEASTVSEIVGKLYAKAGGMVLEYGDEWTKIESGMVTGYVATAYIIIGDEAKSLLEENATYVATVTADALRIRKSRDADSEILSIVAQGTKLDCISVDDEWVKVLYENEEGYVSAQYVEVEMVYAVAMSMEEINASNESKNLSDTEEIDTQSEQAEDALEKIEEDVYEEAAQTEQEYVVEETVKEDTAVPAGENSDTTEAATDTTVAAHDDAYLLACLVYCEAGSESYDGKLAVANVVLNRVNSGYGNSIYDVIYAGGQFGPASNGTLAQALISGPNQGSIDAANEALSGSNNIGDYKSFNVVQSVNLDSLSSYIIIGSHVFF